MEITWFLPGELEIRRRGSGSFLSGAFRYGRTATISDRGRALKERIDGRAFGWQLREFERVQEELSQALGEASTPDAMVSLAAHASNEVFAACGLSPSLFIEGGDGTAQREGWHRALFGVIAPLGRTVEAELREKLDAPDLVLVWDELRASDLAGRARAFQSMIGGGMDVAKAAALAGLTEPE